MNSSQQQFNLSDIPPNVLYVLKMFELSEEPIEQKEIINKTRLTERTARNAISHLKKQNIITSKLSLTDLRAQKHNLTDAYKER